jgi:hypothetical protein
MFSRMTTRLGRHDAPGDAIFLSIRIREALGWAYTLALAFALVYLGEHYVTDELAGSISPRSPPTRSTSRRTTSVARSTSGFRP